MALKSTVCGIVRHARRTRLISKLLSPTVYITRFYRFYQCSNASGRNPQIFDFSLYKSPALPQNLIKQTVPNKNLKLKTMIWL